MPADIWFSTCLLDIDAENKESNYSRDTAYAQQQHWCHNDIAAKLIHDAIQTELTPYCDGYLMQAV